MSTREPSFLPGSWLRKEAKRSGADRSRPTAPVSHVLTATFPSVPLTMRACTDTRSSLATAAPLPSVTTDDSVLVTLRGVSTFTVGAFFGSDPWTVTALRAAEGVAGESSPQALSATVEASTVAASRVVRRRDTGGDLRSGGAARQRTTANHDNRAPWEVPHRGLRAGWTSLRA